MTKYPDRVDLLELMRKSGEALKALSAEQQAAMLQNQRESWVRANRPCEHGNIDFEQCPECRGWNKP